MFGGAPRWALAALVSFASVDSASAAYPTLVLTAVEPERALPQLHLGVRIEQESKQGRITREWAEPGRAFDVRELEFAETSRILTAMGRVGLYRDLEFTIAAPVVLGYDSSIAFAEGVGANSTIYAPGGPNADNPAIEGRFPITEVPAERTRSGFGDMRFGLGWSPVVDRKDEAFPTLTLRAEVTVPTGEVWDPQDQDALPAGPGGKVGLGQTVLDVSVGLSKRARPVAPTLDPYIVFGGRLPFAMSSQRDRGLEPPPSLRLETGAELVFADDRAADTRYAIDFGVRLRYVASGRTYGPLSDYLPALDLTRIESEVPGYDDYANPDNYRGRVEGQSCSGQRLDRVTGMLVPATPGVPCGNLQRVDEHLHLGGHLALHLQPSRYTLFRLGGSLSYITDHLITGEPIGVDTDPPDTAAMCGGGPCAGRVNARNSRGEDERSRFHDPRYDTPGRRLRLEAAFVYTVFVEAIATF